MFSGFAYRATDTELAGRKISATSDKKKIIIDSPAKVLNCGRIKNKGITKIKLHACTRMFPKRSVNQPPSQDPDTEPSPKQPKTNPICGLLKPSSEDIYIPKKGMTMDPDRLMSMTKANSHAAGDNP